ncbi:MAG TPA: thioesterase family protein [Syntrophorhabdaceae bacterium]|jgi:acyl-CoA thioester hydrolase|nr:thioesterase family protein [Syntrophorhabdaceae bacterium]HOS04920.1 thioesterase family protein [Syntrophorhabdaceae bacterium]HPL40254.1 thioesterase family protein [Syntrophorhabdaceae bacterium]
MSEGKKERSMYTTRIYYQDTDAGGVVYFANYLKFFEKSWFEYLFSIGISIPEWERQDTYIIIRNVTLELLEKLRYGDTIQVITSITEVRNAYFILSHTVNKDGKTITKGETKMVCINGKGKPKRIPEEFKDHLLANTAPVSCQPL